MEMKDVKRVVMTMAKSLLLNLIWAILLPISLIAWVIVLIMAAVAVIGHYAGVVIKGVSEALKQLGEEAKETEGDAVTEFVCLDHTEW